MMNSLFWSTGIKRIFPDLLFLFVFLNVLSLTSPSIAQSTATVTITLDASHPRSNAIPADLEGASYSAGLLYDSPTWLTGTLNAYSTMMKRIGVRSLRMGGTSSETGSYPSSQAANNFEDFAQLIGANVIWGVPVTDNYNLSTYSSFVHSMGTVQVQQEPDLLLNL